MTQFDANVLSRRTVVDVPLAIVAWIVTFTALVTVAAVIHGARPGRGDVSPIVRLGKQLMPNNANAGPSGDAMIVANRPETPLVILAAGTLPIRATDYGRVVVEADPLPKDVEITLIWLRRDEPGRAQEQHLARDGAQVVPTALDGNPDWRGDITFLAVAVAGPMQRPWSLRTFRLEPLGIGGVVSDIVRGWTTFEGWDGRSINVLFGGREEQRLWLPPITFGASAISAFAVWLIARKRGRRAVAAALVLPFLIGWLVLDLRWQSNLVKQVQLTWSEFGGRSLEERQLAMADGDLYRFAQAAIAKLPGNPTRIYVASDFEYFQRRAGYHLYPHNVLAYNWSDPSILQPGDYVFLYQKSDVRFDSRQRTLFWQSGPTVPVSALLAQQGAGVFVVRAPGEPPQ